MNARLLVATFVGSVLSFASLAVVHEYGPGECSREARARSELGAELREATAVQTPEAPAEPARRCFISYDETELVLELRRFREESWFVRESHVQCPSCATLTRTGDIRPCPGCGGESPWVLAMRAIVTPPPQEPRAWQDPDNPPPMEGHR